MRRVVLCSSVTATVAMPGQLDYVAASVLDALAAAAWGRGEPWVSVGWDAWRRSARARRRRRRRAGRPARRRPADALTPEEGLHALDRAWHGPRPRPRLDPPDPGAAGPPARARRGAGRGAAPRGARG
ncbi:MAG: KR domain-containing protein [Myxococcota bacterium]